MPSGEPTTPASIERGFVGALAGFFAYHHKVETAPRWTCSECQFESNAFYETHERTCSHYKPAVLRVSENT